MPSNRLSKHWEKRNLPFLWFPPCRIVFCLARIRFEDTAKRIMGDQSFIRNFSAKIGDADIKSIVAAIASISVVGTGLGLTGPLLSLLMERDGLSAGLIGANTAVAGLAAILITPFVTDIARRFGVVNTMAVCIILSATTVIAFYLTPVLPMWFALRFSASLYMCILFVLSEFWINTAASESNRGFILGIYGTVLSLGFAVGPAIVALVGIDGFLPFGIGAGIIILAIIPVLYAVDRQPVIEVAGKTPSILPYLFVVPLATMAGFVFGASEQSELALLPIYGTASGMSAAEAALLLTVLGIGNVVFQIPLGMWSDGVKDRRLILLLCGVFGIAGAAIMPFVIETVWIAYLVVFLWGGVIGGLYTVGLAHLGARLTGADLAQANAAFILCYAIGMTIGPQIVGVTMDLLGRHGFAAGIGVLFAFYLSVCLWRMLPSAR